MHPRTGQGLAGGRGRGGDDLCALQIAEFLTGAGGFGFDAIGKGA
jgi:hypothetical protein